jgi:murein DD-endopeptidase MepM/ murein hydrolase activator NlpD
MKSRGVTIVVHVDGDLNTKQYRVPFWAFEVGKWGALVIGLFVVLFFAFAGPLTVTAARSRHLENEVARLRDENSRVQQLAAALNRAEANYQQMRQILGGKAPDSVSRARTAADEMKATAVRAGTPDSAPKYETGPSLPSHWPLDVQGFVTRGQVGESGASETHEGIDIAVPVGTPVRAAGGGTVVAAGVDPDYGLYVLLQHPDGYESMYGHASRVLVREGQAIPAGEVIALTGSSGRSTAPHLHFEIRRQGTSLDPLTLVKEGH